MRRGAQGCSEVLRCEVLRCGVLRRAVPRRVVELELAKDLMTVSLVHCSRLAKTLSDIHGLLGYGDPTRPYSSAVGEIFGWMFFEVFKPLGREFPELEAWPLQERDWTPDFIAATDLQIAASNVRRMADETLRLADQLFATGLIPQKAIEALRRWALECARFGQRLTT